MATPAAIKAKLEKSRDKTIVKYGVKSAAIGNEEYVKRVVPTPSRMLNFMLGIGGFSYNHITEVFGGNGLGKTSALGYGVLANVQRMGGLPAILAAEPDFDPEWAAEVHGLDPELLLINRPSSAEEGFAMLNDLVEEGLVDYIMIDSVGAMASESEVAGGKTKAYGASGVISSGIKVITPKIFKKGIGVLALNQQRQVGSYNGNTIFDSPGGETLHHLAMVRIHLKPGPGRYTAKVDGKDVLVGRELVCEFKKNKLAQAANKKANFDFYHIETEEYGLGVDQGADLLNVGKLTGVITGSGWYYHSAFPDGKLQGKQKVTEFLQANPKALDAIDADLKEKMVLKEIAAAEEKANNPEVIDESA